MEDQRQPQAPWWQPGLILFYKLSGWVAGPILLAVFVGKFLDKFFNTAPWIFLGLTATSFIFSTFAIIYTYSKELKKVEAEEKKIKDRTTSAGQESSASQEQPSSSDDKSHEK